MCLLGSCSDDSDVENAAPPPPSRPIPETLAQADQLFMQREDIEKLKQARTMVRQLRDPNNRNFDVEFRFAKYSLFLGEKLEGEDEKEKAFEEGRDAGKIASHMQVDRPEGYFWYGANLAELARMNPVTVGYASIDDIRDAMNTVIKIRPDYQGATAYDILAQIEMNKFAGGKTAKAIEYLQKALELVKDNSNLQLHLAQAYLDDDKLDLAKKELQTVVSMTPNPEYAPEHKANVAEAKRLLATRF
jgi:tetratricopeptide (TPR) repeat protein